jgi:hypothetical protein
LSSTGLSSSLLSQIADSSSAANEFVSDLNLLAKDVDSGDLTAAQQDWVTLSQDAQDGATSSTATSSDSGVTTSILSDVAASSTSSSAFVSDLNELGTDLENGDIGSAQNDLLSLSTTAQNAASAASASTASSTPAASQSQIAGLIRAIVDALQAGYTSLAGSALSVLASISPDSKGASVLAQESESLGSTSSSTSSSSTTNALLQSLEPSDSTSSNSTSSFSLLA